MPEDGIDTATERAFANPYWNPRPLERDAVRALDRARLCRREAGAGHDQPSWSVNWER